MVVCPQRYEFLVQQKALRDMKMKKALCGIVSRSRIWYVISSEGDFIIRASCYSFTYLLRVAQFRVVTFLIQHSAWFNFWVYVY